MRFERLSLIYTQKCTAQCDICCLSCGPSQVKKMSLPDALSYVEQAADIPSISKVAISGGEPFIYYKEMLQIVEVARRHKLHSSCVTNGYWATSKDVALRKLSELQRAGLFFINVSADTYHLQYVPIKNVKHILAAADELGIDRSIGCVVTKSSQRLHQILELLGDAAFYATLIEVPCLPVGRAAEKISSSDFFTEAGIPASPCDTLNDLSIDPDGNAYPCCSQAGMTPPLRLGSAKEEPLVVLARHFRGSMVCRLLAQHGPNWFVEPIKKAGLGHKLNPNYVGVCHLCHHVLSDPEMTAIAQEAAQAEGKAIFQRMLDQVRQSKMSLAPPTLKIQEVKRGDRSPAFS